MTKIPSIRFSRYQHDALTPESIALRVCQREEKALWMRIHKGKSLSALKVMERLICKGIVSSFDHTSYIVATYFHSNIEEQFDKELKAVLYRLCKYRISTSFVNHFVEGLKKVDHVTANHICLQDVWQWVRRASSRNGEDSSKLINNICDILYDSHKHSDRICFWIRALSSCNLTRPEAMAFRRALIKKLEQIPPIKNSASGYVLIYLFHRWLQAKYVSHSHHTQFTTLPMEWDKVQRNFHQKPEKANHLVMSHDRYNYGHPKMMQLIYGDGWIDEVQLESTYNHQVAKLLGDDWDSGLDSDSGDESMDQILCDLDTTEKTSKRKKAC